MAGKAGISSENIKIIVYTIKVQPEEKRYFKREQLSVHIKRQLITVWQYRSVNIFNLGIKTVVKNAIELFSVLSQFCPN